MTFSASVVIPMHNGAEVILQQLEGLAASLRSLPDAEIVVVDNRSTDVGPSLVRQWAADTGAPVRVLGAHEKAGEPYARNAGWRVARSDVILYCDADDVVSSTWAGSLAGALEHERYATGPLDTALLNDPRIADLRGQRLFRKVPTLDNGIPFAHGCNMGFRRTVLEQLGGFDESYLIACDIELAVRAWRHEIGLAWAPDAMVHYRLRSTVTEVYRQARAYGRSRRRIDRAVTGAPGTLDWGHQARRAAWLARHTTDLRAFEGRIKWAWVAGQCIGELGGRRPWPG